MIHRTLEEEPPAPKPAGLSSWKSFLFNLVFQNKRVRKIFGSGTVYRNVARHSQRPHNFPLSEDWANCCTLSQNSFGLSDTSLSGLPRIQFSHSVRRCPLGLRLAKLPLVNPNTLKWRHLTKTKLLAIGKRWKMRLNVLGMTAQSQEPFLLMRKTEFF